MKGWGKDPASKSGKIAVKKLINEKAVKHSKPNCLILLWAVKDSNLGPID